MAIHQTAIVEDGALLGADVDIGPFCLVGPRVRLGDGVRLMSHVVLTGNTTIGARTVVHAGSVLGGDGQIRGGIAPDARLEIGADNVIRECVTMNLGSAKGHGVTSVGDRGYFMAYCHIGHDCHIGNDVTFANSTQVAGHVEIGDGVIMGGLTAVQQFGRIGRGAMIGGVTGVNTDIIPYGIAFGDHAELAGLNIVGLKRRGVTRADIHALRSAYRAIFQDHTGAILDRAAQVKETWPNVPQVHEIADFILTPAKRAICAGRKRGPEPIEVD
jgi:UDP-N-acetylglucosamine acyltransferase